MIEQTIKAVLESFKVFMKTEYGLMTIYDPQPIATAEPQVRLTFMGSIDNGNFCRLLFQASVLASGDGPDVFLPAIIATSMIVQNIWDNSEARRVKEIESEAGVVRIRFKPVSNGSGQFIQNEQYESEVRQWAYTYTEPHLVDLEFKKE